MELHTFEILSLVITGITLLLVVMGRFGRWACSRSWCSCCWSSRSSSSPDVS